MTDKRALDDAFAELEQRADAVAARTSFDIPQPGRKQRSPRAGGWLVPAAATVAVAALATGAVVLTQGGGPGEPAGPGSVGAAASPVSAPPNAGSQEFDMPEPDELADRFRRVLGDRATIEVAHTTPGAVVLSGPRHPKSAEDAGPPPKAEPTSLPENAPPPENTAPAAPQDTGTGTKAPSGGKHVGASIVGTLTADGTTGGFQLWVLPPNPDEADRVCADHPGATTCDQLELDDGSTLIVREDELLEPAGAANYWVDWYGKDAHISLTVSTTEDPKGASEVLAEEPPLTTDEMVEVVTSPRW